MCIIVIEPLTTLDRTSRIKLYQKNARSRLFSRIAKRSIVKVKLQTKLRFLPCLRSVCFNVCDVLGSVDRPSVLMEGVRGQHEHHNEQR